MSQKLRKMFFAQKSIFPKFSFWRNPVFSKVFDQWKKPTTYPFTTSPGATNPNNTLLLLQAPAQRAARNAELPRNGGTGKETKVLKEGARSDRAHLTKMKAQ